MKQVSKVVTLYTCIQEISDLILVNCQLSFQWTAPCFTPLPLLPLQCGHIEHTICIHFVNINWNACQNCSFNTSHNYILHINRKKNVRIFLSNFYVTFYSDHNLLLHLTLLFTSFSDDTVSSDRWNVNIIMMWLVYFSKFNPKLSTVNRFAKKI
jgi:hypothetical protein